MTAIAVLTSKLSRIAFRAVSNITESFKNKLPARARDLDALDGLFLI